LENQNMEAAARAAAMAAMADMYDFDDDTFPASHVHDRQEDEEDNMTQTAALDPLLFPSASGAATFATVSRFVPPPLSDSGLDLGFDVFNDLEAVQLLKVLEQQEKKQSEERVRLVPQHQLHLQQKQRQQQQQQQRELEEERERQIAERQLHRQQQEEMRRMQQLEQQQQQMLLADQQQQRYRHQQQQEQQMLLLRQQQQQQQEMLKKHSQEREEVFANRKHPGVPLYEPVPTHQRRAIAEVSMGLRPGKHYMTIALDGR
jgi:hypothetical protein